MPKSNRSGQAAVLSVEQLKELWAELPQPHRVISQVCYYTGSRIGEVLTLRAENIRGNQIVFQAGTTKTKRSKTVGIAPSLAECLKVAELPTKGYLFPGKGRATITRQAFDLALREACDYLGFQGVSSHSFRRSLATRLYRDGLPARDIMSITGHATLESLTLYLELDRERAIAALAAIDDKLQV